MHVFVAGGTGHSGPAIISELVTAGLVLSKQFPAISPLQTKDA